MAVDARRLITFFLQGDSARTADWSPPTDIYRTRSGWLVKMELAGVRNEDLKVVVHGRTLVVSGRRRDCCLEEGCQQLHMEIAYDLFERSIELPAVLDQVKLSTSLVDGMLHIRIDGEAGA